MTYVVLSQCFSLFLIFAARPTVLEIVTLAPQSLRLYGTMVLKAVSRHVTLGQKKLKKFWFIDT
jgi:hypothetical protein